MKNRTYKFLKIVTLLSVLIAATGCQMVIDDLFPSDHNENQIVLKAGYKYVTTDLGAVRQTRGTAADNSGVLYPNTITADLPIGLVRIDQAKADRDANLAPDYTNLAQLDGTLAGTPDADLLREITFGTSQFYANENDYVHYLGWYPSGTFSSNGTATTVTNPIDGKTDILYSNLATGSQSDGLDTMIFNHALSRFNIYVYKMNQVVGGEEQEDGITNWGYLTNITLANSPKTCTYTLPDQLSYSYDDKQSISMGDWVLDDVATGAGHVVDNGNGIYFNGGDIPVGYSAKRLVTHFITAPPRAGMLDLAITTTLASAAKSISIASDFKAGYAYDVVLRFSDHGFINAEVSVGEWEHEGEVNADIEADIYFDLSRYGTANSYIVSSANTGYCFDGDVMGCGNDAGGGSIVGVTNCSLSTEYVDIIYTSSPDLITLKSHQLNDGSIFFFVPGEKTAGGKYDKTNLKLQQEGNVIIAAYDELDGNILWTWHIWITDRPKEQGYLNGYAVLDRNMGATHTPTSVPTANNLTETQKAATYGFFYQWGRKDPMIPALTLSTVDNASQIYTTSTEQATVAEATHNPLKFYGASQTNWTSTANQHLWGYVSTTDEYTKSIYDPCPPGYRVPEKRVWDTLHNYQTTPFGLFSIASIYSWYPSAGYIDSDAATAITNRETANGIYAASAQPDNNSSAYHFEYNATNKKAVSSSSLADAFPVRCISTTVQSIVTNLSRVQTANSYIVSESGSYKFNATVRGNGVTSFRLDNGSLADVGDGMTAGITGISKVDILWWQGELNGANNTAGTDCPIDIVSNTPDANGYIVFNIATDAFSKGNAIVAAFDSSNRVIWSWHFWLTDEPADVLMGDYSVMDRNLGATFAPSATELTAQTISNANRLATYGFYYQWGRKDPFPGPTSYNAGSPSSTASSDWFYKDPATESWAKKTALNATAAASNVSTLAVAAQNPMTFYTATTRWCPNVEDNAATSLWGYGIADQGGQGSGLTKTVNDPCPPGYQVCHHHTWSSAGMDEAVGEGGWIYYNANDDYGQFFPTNNNLCYTNYYTSSGRAMNVEQCWYPFQGYRNASNGRAAEVGTMQTSYTALPWGAASTGNVRTYSMEVDSYYGRIESGQSGSGRSGANGRAVRCARQQ